MKFSNINLANAASPMPAQQSPAGFQQYQQPQVPQGFGFDPASVIQLPVQSAPQQSPEMPVPPQASTYQQNAAPVTQIPVQSQDPCQAPVQASPASRQDPRQGSQSGQTQAAKPLPFELEKARRMQPPVNRNKKLSDPNLTLAENLFKDVQTPVPSVPDALPAAPAPQDLYMEIQKLKGQISAIVAESEAHARVSSLAAMAAEMQSCYKLCELLSRSPFTPRTLQGRPEFVFLAIKYGEGLGLDPFQSLQGITVINGKPCLFGDSLLALCLPHGDIQETFDEQKQMAVCTCRRPGKSPVVRTFSMQEAQDAGLLAFDKNGHALGRSKEGWTPTAPWGAYPKRMLQMRARGFALRDAFPDVLRGVISAEEASDYRV